jgi:hypothetical protein
MIEARVRALAEDTNSYGAVPPGRERLEDPRFVVWLGGPDHPAFTVVQRLRMRGDEVEPTVAEVRELLRDRGLSSCTWEVGSSATPPDLADRLQELGMVPDATPLAVAMVLAEPPPAVPGIEVRPVATVDELRESQEIAIEAFGMPAATADELRATVAQEFALESSDRTTFLAWLDGEPVAMGVARFTDHGAILNAGATRAHARGRGAYRALVRARFEESARRGAPALVTQAGPMSRPILQRLGFREVAEIRIFLDELRREEPSDAYR